MYSSGDSFVALFDLFCYISCAEFAGNYIGNNLLGKYDSVL